MKKYIVSLLACTIFVSCTHEEIPGPDSEAPEAFIASVENIGTKTSAIAAIPTETAMDRNNTIFRVLFAVFFIRSSSLTLYRKLILGDTTPKIPIKETALAKLIIFVPCS